MPKGSKRQQSQKKSTTKLAQARKGKAQSAGVKEPTGTETVAAAEATSQTLSPVPIPVQGASSSAEGSHPTARATPAAKPPFVSPTTSGKKKRKKSRDASSDLRKQARSSPSLSDNDFAQLDVPSQAKFLFHKLNHPRFRRAFEHLANHYSTLSAQADVSSRRSDDGNSRADGSSPGSDDGNSRADGSSRRSDDGNSRADGSSRRSNDGNSRDGSALESQDQELDFSHLLSTVPKTYSEAFPFEFKFNNRKVDVSADEVKPLDYSAFEYHLPEKGGKHRGEGKESDPKFDLKSASYQAQNHATKRMNEALGKCGFFEQKRVAAFHHMSHPDCAPVYQSLGINAEQSMNNAFIANNVKRYLRRVRETEKKQARVSDQRRMITQSILTAALPSPARRKDNDPSDRQILHNLGLPKGSNRTISGAKRKREASATGADDAYDLLGKRKCGPHLGEDYWHGVRKWVENCSLARNMPGMNETVTERDLYGKNVRAVISCFLKTNKSFSYSQSSSFISSGKIVRDNDGNPKKIQKVLISGSPREVHELMTRNDKNGYSAAKNENGRVLVSERCLRAYWPRHVIIMTRQYALTCGCGICEICQNNVQVPLNCLRKRIIMKERLKLKNMRECRAKRLLKAKIDKYQKQIMDQDGELLCTKMKDAVNDTAFACERIEIDGRKLHHFACALGRCDKEGCGCFVAPKFELECDYDITYCLYTGHDWCSKHGPYWMQRVESKKRCLRCLELPDESQGKWYTKKMRTRYTEPLKKFMGPGGVYEKCMNKMIYHKVMVVHHGKDMLMKSREEDAKSDIGCLLTSADYMERFQALPNGELQSEGFGKDESLSIEGRAVNYDRVQRRINEVLRGERLPPHNSANGANGVNDVATTSNQDGAASETPQASNQDDAASNQDDAASETPQPNATEEPTPLTRERVDAFFSSLSDEKVQNGRTTKANIEYMLNYLLGKEIIDPLIFNRIMDHVDGCSGQYRSGTVLYELALLSAEFQITYDREVQASGHGKSTIDAKNGMDKTYLRNFFIRMVQVLGEEEDDEDGEGLKRVSIHKMENGERVSFARTCLEILSDERRQRIQRGQSKTNKKYDNRHFKWHHYHCRDIGVARGHGIDMVAVGFEKGPKNGIQFHHNYVADKEFPMQVAARRLGCKCGGCKRKSKEPKETRYSGPCKECDYWPIFKLPGEEEGLNDWKMLSFKKKSGCDDEEVDELFGITLRGLGKTLASKVVDGGFGAYEVSNDKEYDYYVVQWDGEPFRVEEDKVLTKGNTSVRVSAGEYVCRAVFLEKLYGAADWWTMTTSKKDGSHMRTIVRMQQVLCPDIKLEARSDTNQFEKGTYKRSVAYADQHGAWKMDKDDHNFLIDESINREEFNYIEDGGGGDEGNDGSGEEGGEESDFD